MSAVPRQPFLMRLVVRLTLLAGALTCAATASAASPAVAPLKGPVVCFYGPPPLEQLATYPTVVLQPALVTAADVAALHARGCRVLGYVSLGEDDHLRRGNGKGAGGYAPWYVDEHAGPGFSRPGADGQPDSNPDWASYYVDPSDAGWRRVVKEQTDIIHRQLGMDGVFADTVQIPRDVFTARRERRMLKGMASLVGSLKAWSGGAVIVNNGGAELAVLGDKVDGIMIETRVEGAPDAWRDLQLELARLAPLRAGTFLVTALVYLPAATAPHDACAALNAIDLPAALYRGDDAGRALTALPLATCP